MIGKYERKDGTRFDVIPMPRGGLQRANEKQYGYRPFYPVTKEELEEEISKGLIAKIST